MHSPLLKGSLWDSYPPPTYMLKFSGLADLSSCFFADDWQSEDLCWDSPIVTSLKQMVSVMLSTCARQGGIPWTGCDRRPCCSDTRSTQTVGVRRVDTKTGNLSRVSRKHSAQSSPNGFTTFCYSACLSHFTAPFLIIPTKASSAETCVTKAATARQITRTSRRYWKTQGSPNAVQTSTQEAYQQVTCDIHVRTTGADNASHLPSPVSQARQHQFAMAQSGVYKWSFRRFTYGNLVTTSPSSKW